MSETGERVVLFLCSGNYYRSRFAEELFNHLAREAGLPWRATSSGLRVDEGLSMNIGPLSWWARQGLEERGIAAAGAQRMPRQVSERELEGAAIVVAVKEAEHRPLMRRRHPAWESRVRYWAVDDLDCAQPSEALGELERLVRELIAELGRLPPA